MKTFQVFDPPMCCSSGVCGPAVDPVLVRFAADLRWLATQEVKVERFNLTQTPLAFADNAVVCAVLAEKGEAALPLVLAEGKVAISGAYPTRIELAALFGLDATPVERFSPVGKVGMSVAKPPGSCGCG